MSMGKGFAALANGGLNAAQSAAAPMRQLPVSKMSAMGGAPAAGGKSLA